MTGSDADSDISTLKIFSVVASEAAGGDISFVMDAPSSQRAARLTMNPKPRAGPAPRDGATIVADGGSSWSSAETFGTGAAIVDGSVKSEVKACSGVNSGWSGAGISEGDRAIALGASVKAAIGASASEAGPLGARLRYGRRLQILLNVSGNRRSGGILRRRVNGIASRDFVVDPIVSRVGGSARDRST